MHSDLPVLDPETPGATGSETAGDACGDHGAPLSYPGVGVGLAIANPHYLGPVILAQGRVIGLPNTNPEMRAIRNRFALNSTTCFPPAAGGNLFLPVDETIPGAGYGPVQDGNGGAIKYTQNRATIHLHGNNTIWISDGNVHQWISPAGENTPYPKGVSVGNVPDMMDESGTAVDCDAPGSGCMTFYYTNAQSARLQFYHDHAFGITRLNVYAGEVDVYVLTDAVDQDMINGTNVTCKPWPSQSPSRHRHSPDHPGQDFRIRRSPSASMEAP